MSVPQLAYVAGMRPAADPGFGVSTDGPRIAVGGVDYIDPEAKPLCHATKTDGSACGARPVRGEELCIGHKRSLKE